MLLAVKCALQSASQVGALDIGYQPGITSNGLKAFKVLYLLGAVSDYYSVSALLVHILSQYTYCILSYVSQYTYCILFQYFKTFPLGISIPLSIPVTNIAFYQILLSILRTTQYSVSVYCRVHTIELTNVSVAGIGGCGDPK